MIRRTSGRAPTALLCSLLGLFVLSFCDVAEGKGKVPNWWMRDARPHSSGYRKATPSETKAIRSAMKKVGITRPLGKIVYFKDGHKHRVLGLSLQVQVAEKPSPNGGRLFEVIVRNKYSRTGLLRAVNPKELMRGELGPGVLEGHIFKSNMVKLHEWSVPYTGRLVLGRQGGTTLDVTSSR